MAVSHFLSARLKVEWAVRHINDLHSGLQQLAREPNFYRLFVDNDGDAPAIAIETKPLSPWFALHLGDAIHSLRVALDHLMSEIARRAGKDGPRIHFPFHATRDDLVRSSSYRTVEGFAPDVALVIADTIKPYEAGNRPLWALNRLDNIDKHRLLIPTLMMTSIGPVSAETSTGQKVKDCLLASTGGGRARIIGLRGTVEITDYGKPTFDILFPRDAYFGDQSVVPTLHQLAQLVLGVIQTLETHCFRGQ